MGFWQAGYKEFGDLDSDQIFALRREAQELFPKSHEDTLERYIGPRPDGSFSTPSSCRYSFSGDAINRIHHSEVLLRELRDELGRPNLEPTRCSYTYYMPNSYLGLHRDVEVCTITLLIGFTANLGPLSFAMRKRHATNEDLAEFVQTEGYYPEPDLELDLPTSRFLGIDGRTIPHWRNIHSDSKPGAIATLCYYGED